MSVHLPSCKYGNNEVHNNGHDYLALHHSTTTDYLILILLLPASLPPSYSSSSVCMHYVFFIEGEKGVER